MNSVTVIQAFCALSFFGFGISCLCSRHMAAEFRRYGIPQFRALTGWLQIGAACGLIVGLWLPRAAGIAAAGLALQMACGLAVRLRIRDTWLQCSPASAYLLLSGWLAWQLL